MRKGKGKNEVPTIKQIKIEFWLEKQRERERDRACDPLNGYVEH